MEFISVFSAVNAVDADLVRSRLAAAGFNPTIAHELPAANIAGFTPGSGINVQVPEAEADDAREFLAAPGDAPPA